MLCLHTSRDLQDLTVICVLYAGEAAALLPVVGMMLQFSPAEIKRCHEALAREGAAEGIVDASAMSSVDGSSSEHGMLSGTACHDLMGMGRLW